MIWRIDRSPRQEDPVSRLLVGENDKALAILTSNCTTAQARLIQAAPTLLKLLREAASELGADDTDWGETAKILLTQLE